MEANLETTKETNLGNRQKTRMERGMETGLEDN